MSSQVGSDFQCLFAICDSATTLYGSYIEFLFSLATLIRIFCIKKETFKYKKRM